MCVRFVGVLAALTLLAGCASRVGGHGSLASGASLFPTSVLPPSSTTDPQPSATGTVRPGSCAGSRVGTTADSPLGVVLRSSPDGLPLNPRSSGRKSLDELVRLDYGDDPQARQVLTATRYRDGAQNTWSVGQAGQPGHRLDYAAVLEFRDGVGSCAFAAWEARLVGARPDARAGVPDGQAAVVRGSGTARPVTIECLTVKGRFVLITGMLFYGPGDLLPFVAAMLRLQYGAV